MVYCAREVVFFDLRGRPAMPRLECCSTGTSVCLHSGGAIETCFSSLQATDDSNGAADDHSEPETATVHGEVRENTLESCLAAFFAPETVEWLCPEERKKQQATKTSENGFHTPKASNTRSMSRIVSFSGEVPTFCLCTILSVAAFSIPCVHLSWVVATKLHIVLAL